MSTPAILFMCAKMERVLLPHHHHVQSGFTTCPSLSHASLIHANLSDSDLGVHKITSKTPPRQLVCPPPPMLYDPNRDLPPPEQAWQAFYPKGSINPSAAIPGGFGFYLSGPKEFAKGLEEGAEEVLFSYRMMLQDGWESVKGGKLPGIFGGEGDLSYRCTGGRQNDRCKCFNVRPMWRANHVGELYTYFPLTDNNKRQLLAVPPESKENSDYGFSVGRKAFDFRNAIGRWIALALRVKVNGVGEENGELELLVDGISVMSVKNLTLRDSSDGKIKGIHFQTFFGGHGEDWASPKDQYAWFADVTGAVIR